MFSLIVGFAGSFFSLLISKPVAKWSTGAHVIDGSEGPTERWLVDTVGRLAERAGLARPEVAYYEGQPNAFATGAFRNSALAPPVTRAVFCSAVLTFCAGSSRGPAECDHITNVNPEGRTPCCAWKIVSP